MIENVFLSPNTLKSGEENENEASARPNFGTAHFKVSLSLGLGAAVSDYDGWQEENEEKR